MTMQASPALAARVDWDGRELRLHGVDGEIELWLDGVFYARLAGQDGAARLALPCAPNGRTRVNLELRRGAACSAAVALESGRAGLGRAAAALPLAPLENDEYVDIAACAAGLAGEAAIVVPVYNAPQAVRACLDSVLAHTRGAARLIVIDDASPDPAVAPLLQDYAGRRGVSVLRNEQNLGFTGTANRGIAAAGRADVVLLNADTEVAPHWLCGLRRAAWSHAAIASATAVSDNAGAFSVPELEQENPLPQDWSFAQAALALWQQAGTAYPRLPTGNGFCLYLKRAALDAVGVLDAEAFPQGYGEENDWCQRAAAAGWQHVIAGNVLVRHARSQSFGHERRRALGEAGMAVLRRRWPHYESEVGASLFSPRRRVLDWRVRRLYAEAPPLPRLLCWEDAEVGATNHSAWRAGFGGGGIWLQGPQGVQETFGSENLAAAAARADQAAAFARLLQRWAIARISGALPAHLAAVAAALNIAGDGWRVANPFGDGA
ncbi:glycosyltransferase family 2 protein [Tahibacter harae]|uniref:Glycosyltransferase n=1 Tax=Tahibacter harae TaxID=2963937 RepID=A0ABT1QTS1_9GAMM|nr:glycosyltransferase [Tahibacter harae]MCQ4165683.1 glycosyltransferase [Tahibacter harae]